MPYNTGRATLAGMWVEEHLDGGTTKAVCLAALNAVGRLSWANGMVDFSVLLPGNALNTKNIGCVCYEAPVVFALMGYAVSIHEAKVFFAHSTKQDSNARLINHIYGRIVAHVRTWNPGDDAIPAGAMVYHGDTTNACRHVTMSLGNGDVVSCWGAAQAQPAIGGAAGLQSEAYKIYVKQVDDLLAKKLSPDTVVVPATAFTDVNNQHTTIKYTNGPFWDFW